uniref:VWFA domain-containing protein n=1 Tax=Setaria digitata TaxID=48799 RepID=A0A915Q4S9_9BILA
MIKLLLVAVASTVCKAQYGDVAPPAPVPPLNYGSEETSNTNKASSPENGYENPTEQITQPQVTVAPDHVVGNVTCRVPVETQELPQQSSIPISSTTRSSPKPSKLPSFSQRPTTSPSRPQTLSTTKATQQTTRRPTQTTVTTRSRTASSRRPGSVLTTRPTQTTARITSKQTSAAPRTTRLPTTPATEVIQPDKETTRRPEIRPVSSADCTKTFDTLFVVDSTSSVRHFFDDHLMYIVETIKMILPDNDNETRIGLIEYSSPLRRQVKIPFASHGNRTEIIEMIKKLPFFAGITATGAALKLALEVLQERRPNVLTNVVVLTDGFSYDYVDEAATMLHRLPNVRTFTATVTDSWREYELETIAGDPKKVFKGKDSVRDLARALTSCDSTVRVRGSRRSNVFK